MRRSRYNSINAALRERFGCKVYKVSLETGFGCPDRCAFCSEASYITADIKETGKGPDTIRESLTNGIEYVKRRHNAAKFISYFQSGTNTYGPVERSREIFSAAIDHPDVVGLAIGTRPDRISKEHIDLLEELSERTMLWVELGLQSAKDETLRLIRRGHTAADLLSAAGALKRRNITVVAHVILGLPGESPEDMIRTAEFLNGSKIDGVKVHNLHVLKGTLMEEWYREGKVKIPDLATYASWVADFLEHLDPAILVHRVNGHAPRHITVAPAWSVNKLAIFNAVEKELERRNTYQGRFFL